MQCNASGRIALFIDDLRRAYCCVVTCRGRFVSWQADGPFPTTRKTLYSGGNLTVFNLGKEDHGVYECVAASVVSSAITSTMLIIERTLYTPCSEKSGIFVLERNFTTTGSIFLQFSVTITE